jgi:LuxR family maltose regulon positive regulatory protein
MQRPSTFLRSKLMPPRAVSDVLPRPRLLQALEGNLQSPVTLVAADAGCGKTTLVSEFIRTQTRQAVWYQLDHTDAEPSAFLGYLTHGIRNIVPNFGEAILEYLADANEELLRTPERAADLLINEILESVEQPLMIVLDDYHHIGRETVVHRIVDRLLQYSSDLVHLFITTRDLPPLSMMRRRAQDSVLILTREDLLFTDVEVKDLFKKTLGIDLSGEELEAYRDRTHGWVTALQLVRQVAEQERHLAGERPVDLVEVLQRSEKDIFDYFAEEVFTRETEPVQHLLLSLALLESLPLETCSLLFPDLRCSAMLPELAQKNVFLTVSGDGRDGEEYRLHPLFREFLLRRLRSSIGRAGIAAERNRIASIFLDQNNWQSALSFLLDAENFDEAASIIAAHGSELIAAGAVVTLDGYAARIPSESLRRHPESLLQCAEVARIQGSVDRATDLLKDAIRIFSDQGNSPGEAEALQSLASIARRRGDISGALEYLDRAETLAPADSETLLKCANTRGLCWISEGKWVEAEQQFRFALELAEQQGNRHYQRLLMHNLALPPGLRGDFGEALRWFRRIFGSGEAAKQLPQEAIGHLNVARLHLYRGEFDETAGHLERSLEICQLFNMRLLRPEIFEAYGNYYRDIDDFHHAEEFYERAAKAYDEVEIEIATKELNEERARMLIRVGNLRRARALLESLVEARDSGSNSPRTATARLGLCQIDLLERKLDGLSQRVSELHKYFHEANHHYDEALAAMLLAEIKLAQGSEGEAARLVDRVMDLSARFDYDFWLKREIRRNPALFAIEEIAERLPADLKVEMADRPEAVVHDRHFSSGEVAAVIDLAVSVLGPVEIVRDPSQPFAPDAWTTRRARDIFCFIATSKHRRVAKDILIDTFWPDEDPAVVEKNFHPTISHIRKALNSRQTFKQNFLVFRDGAYQLNPDLSYLIDAEEFDRSVADAEAAKREKNNERLRESLEKAHRLYRGEYMPGIYEDWVEERRIYYSAQFARVSGALAKLSFAERRFADAIKHASESLKLDPYREDMHRLTLKTYAVQDKIPAAKKHFASMSALLRDELGIEPSSETRRLARELGLS